ncbi:MAG: hypothetical protein ACI8T1_003175 [Verrucomicrobiales bacterium]|jgi:uncharacterized protein (UPF0261 family)
MATIALLGTLDTKGLEYGFAAEQIRLRGHDVLIIDVGTLDSPQLAPDITREDVLATLSEAPYLTEDRGTAVAAMAEAAPLVLASLVEERAIDGVLALGGSGGTAIATAAMQALPIGFPKVMVSTMASGNTAPYVGVKDIVMIPSIVDVAGLNQISKTVFAQAVGALCGMIETPPVINDSDKPIIAASMFGNTTDCVQAAKASLEGEGYEVLVFHATGAGGRSMEALIASGLVVGVLDITTTEWADELVGGVLAAGPERLEAAARRGVPAVVVPGCLDMVNFQAPNTIPAKFKGRTFYEHNPQITLMRTNADECDQLGKILAEKLNLSVGPVSVLLPLKGISVISQEGQPFHDPQADAALFDSLKSHLREGIAVIDWNHAINDDAFAIACAKTLLESINRV